MHFIEPNIAHKLGPKSKETTETLARLERNRQNRFFQKSTDDISFLVKSLTEQTVVTIGRGTNVVTGVVKGVFIDNDGMFAEIETEHDHIFGPKLVTYSIERQR